MTDVPLSRELADLASSLENAVQLATTRAEHIRVSGHATRARALADRAIHEDQNPRLEPRPAA